MTTLPDLITAAREMRDACVQQCALYPGSDDGDADAATEHFDAVADSAELAEHMLALAPAMEVLHAIDDVLVRADNLRALLGPAPPEPDTAAAIRRYGAESPAMQIWLALQGVERLAAAWPAYLAAVRPAVVTVARTME